MAVTRIAGAANPGSASRPNRRTSGHRWTSFPGARLAMLGSAAVFLLILCAYRILTFVPRPFDTPGTLRPFLYALFSWFIRLYPNPEQAQQAWGTYCIVALLIPTILA